MTPTDVFIDFFERILQTERGRGRRPHRRSRSPHRVDPRIHHDRLARLAHGPGAGRAGRGTAAGTEEVWISQGWVERFALDIRHRRTDGYGHTSEQVRGQSGASAELLADYLRDVPRERPSPTCATVTEADLDEVID